MSACLLLTRRFAGGLRARQMKPGFPAFVLLLFCFCIAPLSASAWAAPLRVALLLESDASDGGMADQMRQGLERAGAKADIEARVVICPPESDQTALFREAAETSDLVLLAEPRLHMVLRDNAARYRRVSFGCVDTGVRAPNIMSITFADEEAGFLAGAAAAMLLKDGQKLGWIEDEEGPVHENILAAWMAGAQVQRPDTRVVRRSCGFAGTSTDALQEMAAAGVGLVAVAAGYAGPAQFRNVAATSMLAMGTDGEHFSEAADKVPFSIVKRYDKAVEELVLARANNQFQGKKILVYDLANKGVDLVLNPVFKKSSGLPQHIERRMNDLRHEIANGNIHLQDKRIRTLCDCLD